MNLFLWVAIAGAGQLAEPATAPADVVIEHCLVSLIEQAQVPAEEAGSLRQILVAEGARIKKGQLLAQIDDRQALAQQKVAEREWTAAQKMAGDNVKVQAAAAEALVAESQFLQGSDLPSHDREGELSDRLLRRLLLAPRRAGLLTQAAQLDFSLAALRSDVSEAEVDQARLSVERRRILAPMSGVVVQTYRHVGEWVQPGDAVMHIVGMEKLRIEGYVPAAEISPQEVIGKPVTIAVRLARGQQKVLTSRIEHASPLVETSGGYRVWALVDNPEEGGYWVLRPGLAATMTIHL
ncbi:efflux RND transporter periplasmic adaptor subunit [Lignipirellula cremea]|nr:HlyD family efflux transporter periplasmic adaptor subunit [Lignipirellula cremea]